MGAYGGIRQTKQNCPCIGFKGTVATLHSYEQIMEGCRVKCI